MKISARPRAYAVYEVTEIGMGLDDGWLLKSVNSPFPAALAFRRMGFRSGTLDLAPFRPLAPRRPETLCPCSVARDLLFHRRMRGVQRLFVLVQLLAICYFSPVDITAVLHAL